MRPYTQHLRLIRGMLLALLLIIVAAGCTGTQKLLDQDPAEAIQTVKDLRAYIGEVKWLVDVGELDWAYAALDTLTNLAEFRYGALPEGVYDKSQFEFRRGLYNGSPPDHEFGEVGDAEYRSEQAEGLRYALKYLIYMADEWEWRLLIDELFMGEFSSIPNLLQQGKGPEAIRFATEKAEEAMEQGKFNLAGNIIYATDRNLVRGLPGEVRAKTRTRVLFLEGGYRAIKEPDHPQVQEGLRKAFVALRTLADEWEAWLKKTSQ